MYDFLKRFEEIFRKVPTANPLNRSCLLLFREMKIDMEINALLNHDDRDKPGLLMINRFVPPVHYLVKMFHKLDLDLARLRQAPS